MKDIQRIFQYHGAEHKCIFAYEAGEELTVANARKHSSPPRCDSSCDRGHRQHFSFPPSFLFLPKFPSLGKGLTNLIYVGIKLPLLFPIAGLAYEVIKLSGKKADHPLLKWIIAPGLWLQRLTTRPPADDQIEIACEGPPGSPADRNRPEDNTLKEWIG
jgi:uncharacterized protein YqhQ